MKKLTAEDIRALQHGDVVYRWDGTTFRKLSFVAPMPNVDRYFIFCNGTYLTYLYISTADNFTDDWYGGKYDSTFVGNLKIEALESRIKSIKKIYFKEQ